MASDGIRAGKAFVELTTQDKGLARGLDGVTKRLQAFGASARAIGAQLVTTGAALTAPFIASVKVFTDVGGALVDASARTGVAVERLSELGHAAEQSGADMETLEGGLRKMQKNLFEAAGGSKTAIAAFARLNVTVADLANLSPDEQFRLIADRLSAIQNPAARAGAAMDIFGKSGTKLLPLMSGGAAGIRELEGEARRLGLTISGEDATAAEEFGDALDTLWKVVRRGVFAVGAALAPALKGFVATATTVGSAISAWIDQNRDLIVSAFQIAVGVAAAGAALVAIGVAASGLGVVLSTVSGAFTAIGTAVGVLGSILAALVSPIGLVIAGVTALVAYLITSTEAGAQALTWLSTQFETLKQTALVSFQGIGDALAAGDLSLAAKILWLTLKMEWQRGITFLQTQWAVFKGFFLKTATDAFYGALALLNDAWAGLQVAWVETVGFLADTWSVFTTALTKGWRTAQTFISKGILHLMSLFDSELDVEAASKVLDEDLNRANSQSQTELNRTLAERETTRQSKRQGIEGERSAVEAEIVNAAAAENQQREGQDAAVLKESEEALQSARREWEQAVGEAAKKRAATEGAKPEQAPHGLQKFQQSLPEIDDLLEVARDQSVEVRGTFNAAAVRGLGGGDPADRTAKASEEVAKNTKRLVEHAQHGGLVFG